METYREFRQRFHGTRLPWLRFLLYWKAALATGFDNRVRRAFFGRSLYDLGGREGRILPPGPLQVLLDGRVEQWEAFFLCRDVIVDFGRCRPADTRHSPASFFFEEGFIRMGDRVSPPSEGLSELFKELQFDRWRRTHEPPPAATEFAPGKTVLFFSYYGDNIAETMRHLVQCQYVFDRTGTPDGDELLLLFAHVRLHGEVQVLRDSPFHARRIGSGVFLFRKMAFFLPSTTVVSSRSYRGVLPWFTSDTFAAFRRRLLTAFDVESRVRVRDVGRITLISRQDPLSGHGFTTRKIANEDEIVAALRERFSDAEVTKVALERLPMKEQLSLMHRTDVLIGMHGAGFGFCSVLAPNAGVLGLLPAYFRHWHWPRNFYTVLINNQCHYRRWINLNPRREFSSETHMRKWPALPKELFVPRRDFTRVPPSMVVRKVEGLRQQIRKTAQCGNE